MKKKNIIKKNTEFEQLLKIKTPYKNEYFNIYVKNNNLNYDRFGIAVPKKTGKAVLRNKIKRQLKDIVDKYPYFNNNYDYLIMTKPKIIELSYSAIKDNLFFILNKIIKESNNEKNN